ncbi:hypothetical protein [Streptococcus agalactiae]|uniref:hypothetical protein n=1 Tax=Streptococcus agalactiae TaxID=1311 RepID=UPI0024BA6211|nr:hypothetical protein [Streptococcus agalactiae]
MFKLYFEINGTTKLQSVHHTQSQAIDAVKQLIKDKSSLPIRHNWGMHIIYNKLIIDYGAHNAKYIIEGKVKL